MEPPPTRTAGLPASLPPAKRDEWAALSDDDRRLLTADAVARWTGDLHEDDYTLRDLVRFERRRLDALRTLRADADLTDREWQLLRFLRRNEGKTCTYLDIARQLWQTPSNRITARSLMTSMDAGRFYAAPMIVTIHALIHHLRRKLEVDPRRPQHIASIRGVGYRWYSAPPSLDDGENYAARETEAAVLRRRLQDEGLFEGEFVAIRDADGVTIATSVTPGPEHPDYPALPVADDDRAQRNIAADALGGPHGR
jgi:hypothetical protein